VDRGAAQNPLVPLWIQKKKNVGAPTFKVILYLLINYNNPVMLPAFRMVRVRMILEIVGGSVRMKRIRVRLIQPEKS
jgi:hypothetical protein